METEIIAAFEKDIEASRIKVKELSEQHKKSYKSLVIARKELKRKEVYRANYLGETKRFRKREKVDLELKEKEVL
mgnify:CR=1 FL=1